VVRRKVARLAERALALRQKEVLELDTFAVPELIDALGRVDGPTDVARIGRLAPALSHATGVAWELGPNASVREAEALASRWRSWSLENRMDFTTLDGPGRLTAVVTETRYFRWLRSALALSRRDDALALSRSLATVGVAAKSLASALLCLAAGLVLGSLAAARARRSARPHVAFDFVTLSLASAPLAFLALRAVGLGRSALFLVLVLAVAAFVAHDAASEPLPTRRRDILWRACLHAAPLLAALVAALLGAEALTGTGLGALMRGALGTGELEVLMMAAFPIALLGLFASTLGAAAAVYRPQSEAAELLVWPTRRRVGIALVPAALFALVAVAGSFFGEGSRSLAGGLGSLLFSIVIASAVAALVTLTLGFVAGMVSRSADVVLARAYEVSSALPSALVAGALLTLGGALGPVLFGVLRGIDAAFLFRTRLSEGRQALELEPISLGRTPILPHLSRLLPAAARQPLACLFTTGGWLFALGVSAAALGVPPPGALAPIAGPTGPGGSFAAALVTLSGAALFALLVSEQGDDESPGAPVVLSLSRRRDSSPNPG
jgi:hypothetical protein